MPVNGNTQHQEHLSNKTGHLTENLRKNTKNNLKMTPKWLQNEPQSGPKTIQRALRTEKHKLSLIFSIFGRPGASKWRPEIIKKLEKPNSGTLFYSLKKPWFPRHLFYCFFHVLETTKPWKSSQNAVLYAKIVGRHFLIEVRFFRKNAQKITSQCT